MRRDRNAVSTNYPPGDFCVSATADPRRLFMEKTRSNNTVSARVRITSKDARVIRQGC